jgi:hypothetical protein
VKSYEEVEAGGAGVGVKLKGYGVVEAGEACTGVEIRVMK